MRLKGVTTKDPVGSIIMYNVLLGWKQVSLVIHLHSSGDLFPLLIEKEDFNVNSNSSRDFIS